MPSCSADIRAEVDVQDMPGDGVIEGKTRASSGSNAMAGKKSGVTALSGLLGNDKLLDNATSTASKSSGSTLTSLNSGAIPTISKDKKPLRQDMKPEVLIAALEILQRKKDGALDKHNYVEAGKIHTKMEKLEEMLGVTWSELQKNPILMENLMKKSKAAALGGTGSALGRKKVEKPGFLAAANPFKTYAMLKDYGYSSKTAIALLIAIYAIVLVLEFVLLRVGVMVLEVMNRGAPNTTTGQFEWNSDGSSGHAVEDL